MGVLKIFGTKVSYLTKPDKLTKNECFLSSFNGGGSSYVYRVIRPV